MQLIVRKRQKRFNYGQRCTPVSLDDYSMDNISVYNSVRRKGALRASKRSYGNPAFDDSVREHDFNSRPKRCVNFVFAFSRLVVCLKLDSYSRARTHTYTHRAGHSKGRFWCNVKCWRPGFRRFSLRKYSSPTSYDFNFFAYTFMIHYLKKI